MTQNYRIERNKAEKIIRKYKWSHAGTAIAVGTFGGQFGLDRIPLTMLTISMIKEICNAYGVTEPLPITIHCISAIIRLTYRGTTIGVALNWLPGGSLVNGGVTFSLTSQCGHECMTDIENNRMNNMEQLIMAFGRSTVDLACGVMEKVGDNVSGKIVDGIRESLDVSAPLNEVKGMASNCITGITRSVITGKGVPSLRDFLLSTISLEILDVSFTELAERNGSFVNNRNDIVRHLQQMKTKEPVFEAFDKQLDGWIEQTQRTPNKKELKSLMKIFDNELKNILGNNIPGKLVSRGTAWAMANEAGSMARNGDFVPAS